MTSQESNDILERLAELCAELSGRGLTVAYTLDETTHVMQIGLLAPHGAGADYRIEGVAKGRFLDDEQFDELAAPMRQFAERYGCVEEWTTPVAFTMTHDPDDFREPEPRRIPPFSAN